MPIVDRWTLMLLDGVVQTAGVVIIIFAIIALVRRREMSRMVGDISPIVGEPDALAITAVMIGYLSAISGATLAVQQSGIPLSGPDAGPGSTGWFLLAGSDAAAKLLVSVAMMVVLARSPLFELRPLALPRAARVGVLAGLAAVPICMSQLWLIVEVWHYFQPAVEKPVHPVIQAMTQSAWGVWGQIVLAAAAVVVAPLAEELFFRGLLLNFAIRVFARPWPAIAVTSVAFGMIHYTQPQDVLPLITLGALLAGLRLRFNSIAVCVFAHAVFNARTIAMLLLNPEAAREMP